jgi:radical SAM-linked protein
LTYLAASFMTTSHVGIGGWNIPPRGDGWIADCVANAPGGPMHVLLSDREAEHIPGCSMAFRKSALPVAVTGGKERRFKIAFGPPLPLGMTSGAEFLDVAFVREVPEPFVSSLNESLPEGITVVALAPMRAEPDSLSSVIQIATYEVSFPDSLIRRYLRDMSFDELRARLEDRVASVKASTRLDITKGRGTERKTFNARPSMLRAEVVRDDGGRPMLSLALTLNRPDSARPELWTAALLDWTRVDERLLRVHRSGLYIPGRQSWLDPLDVVDRSSVIGAVPTAVIVCRYGRGVSR